LSNREPLGTSIAFAEVTDFYFLYDQLRTTHAELEKTKGELERTNEELEATNEELQSANEELETTNEELQSANEELETTNAELQSTNEELESTNVQLHTLASEVERSNKFLQVVLSGLRYGMIVLDETRKVLVWNHYCEEMWGLRSDEVVGKNFFGLEMGLPLQSLHDMIDKNEFTSPVRLSSTNRRGRKFECRVRPAPLVGRGLSNGLVLLLDEVPPPNNGSQNSLRLQ